MPPARSEPCPCGSGKKYKHCCEGRAAPGAPGTAELNQLVTLFQAGRYTDLEQGACALLARYPESGFAWKALGLALQVQNKDALQALRKAAALLPGDAEAHNNLGNALKDLGQLEMAVASYQRALKINPGYALAHNNLGAAFQDLGQVDGAAASYRRAVALQPDFAAAHNNLGYLLHALGQHVEAAASCRNALRLSPEFFEAHVNLGNALKDLGQLDAAVASYRRALEINPNLAEAYNNLGAVLQGLGQLDDAAANFRKALEIDPGYASAYSNLGNALRDSGQLDAAVANYRRALEIQPNYTDAHNNLGTALQALGQFDEALASYGRALEIKSDFAEAYNNLGNVLKEMGRLDEAVASCRMALKIKPDYADAHNNLGNALKGLGQLEDAVTSYRRALEIKSDFPEVYVNLGNALREMGRLEGAAASCRMALEVNPDYADAHNALGRALKELGQLDDAITSYRCALAIQPEYAEAHLNLGIALNMLGQTDDAFASYRRALALQADSLDTNRVYLAALLYRADLTLDQRHKEYVAYASRVCSSLDGRHYAFFKMCDPRKKLRIAYVSSDFRDHPVARNIQPLIEYRDRSGSEIYLYGNVKRPDKMTEWFKASTNAWRSIVGMTDQAAAELIRRDEIDILVLLAGSFDENRPLIASFRAAPVQVSFHDPATSGLKAMDYLISDTMLSPRNTREWFAERLVRLPTFYVHLPIRNAPDVGPLPARGKGYITFGSFNNPSKVNEQVVALWSQVLHAVPGSRLMLKYRDLFGSESIRQRYAEMFLARGIEGHRLDLLGASEASEQHLARYADIDIALDPFPFTGSTTTFEALWMGVPVVTLLGDHMVARWSGAMLKKLKLDELIAPDTDAYVAIAQGLAQNTERLESLRAGLRERVAESPLCDAQQRTRQIERAFRWMWAKWCSGHSVAPQ